MKRTFSNSEKQAVALVTGREGEADHITPFSTGGPTTVENCQLISMNTNRKKSAFNFQPRNWQSEFFEDWSNREPGKPFMLIAIPGGGKTMAALEVARQWMAIGADRRTVVVVPTDGLRTQWRDEAIKFGIELQTKEFGTSFKVGFQGGVTTYHTVANQSLVFRKLCSVAPTLVIFDEIHHCGDDSHFGKGIKEAFELSAEKLPMSGTPWKTDGTPIPFLRYNGGGYVMANHHYEYPDALNDTVVRYLVFDHAKGEIQNDLTGDKQQLDGSVSDTEAASRLKRLLDPNGDYVRQQIKDAHRKLLECRRTIPDAAALAACIDQGHALKVAQVIREVTGTHPSIIVSDSEVENDNISHFRDSSKEWLVCVRKVSEGTDIKRLQVLCYLTTPTTEIFFRQLIGRVSRVRGEDDPEGYVFLPADPRLIEFARNITNAQVQAIHEQAEREARELERGEIQPDFNTWSTAHNGTDQVVMTGDVIPPKEAEELKRISEAVNVPMQKVREILSLSDALPTASQMDAIPTETPLEERMQKLRNKCKKAGNKLAFLSRVHFQAVHGKFKPQSQMSESELQAKYKALIQEINQIKA